MSSSSIGYTNLSGGHLETNDEPDQNESSNNLGFFAVIFLTVNATLGAGLLNIPYAFNESGGILFSSIFQIIHLFLVITSLIILSYCTQISKADSLQSLVKFFCGQGWSHLCAGSIFLYSYGACVTYLIIIGDQFDKIFHAFYGPDYINYWYMNRGFLMFSVSIITILPMCLSKDISFLKFASFIGFISTFYLTVLVLLECIKIDPKDVYIKTRPDHWTEVFNIVPVLTFSYQCQLSWVPTYSQIKNKTNYFSVFSMIFISMLICFLSYTWTAVFGLLTFGSNHIEKDMMQNYNPSDPFVSFGMFLLVVKTIVVYPILLFCGRIVLEEFLSTLRTINTNDTSICGLNTSTVIRIVCASVWVLSSCIVAVFVPNIAIVINYLGSLANLFVFILPGLSLYSSLFNDNLQILQNESRLFHNKTTIFIISTFFISYGLFIFSMSLIQSVYNLMYKPQIVSKNLFMLY